MKPLVEPMAKDLMHYPIITAKESMNCRDIMNLLLKSHVSGLPVTDNAGRLVGMITLRDIVRIKHDLPYMPTMADSQNGFVKDYMISRVFTAYPDDPISKIATLIYENHIHRVVIVNKKNQPVGIVTASDFASYYHRQLSGNPGSSPPASETSGLPEALVKDYMSKHLITIRENDSVNTLLELLGHTHVSGVPVINEQGDLTGIVTRTDLSHPVLLRFLREGRSLYELFVKDIYTSHRVIDVYVDDTIAHASKVMLDSQIHRVMVINHEQRYVGILTSTDIMRLCSENHTVPERQPLTDVHIVVETAANVPCSLALREWEIQMLRLLAQEKTMNEIADILHMQADEVLVEKENLLTKLNARTIGEAVAKAIEEGLYNYRFSCEKNI